MSNDDNKCNLTVLGNYIIKALLMTYVTVRGFPINTLIGNVFGFLATFCILQAKCSNDVPKTNFNVKTVPSLRASQTF